MYEIEKNVEVPIERIEYPFNQMEIGDSFFVEEYYEKAKINLICNIRGHAYRHSPDRKFLFRRVEGGIRCWRIE